MVAGGLPRKYKVVLVGNEAAGKTSVVRRYMYDLFEETMPSTVGMDFQSRTVYVGDEALRLQLWDTAGQERFRSLVSSYLRDAAAAVVVYDVTRRASFEATRTWIDAVRNERGNQALLMLVGNKSDLASQRQVAEVEGQGQAKELGISFAETSAKLGQKVEQLFSQLATNLLAAEGCEEQPRVHGLQLRAEPDATKTGQHKTCAC